jgi:hypothetical protein
MTRGTPARLIPPPRIRLDIRQRFRLIVEEAFANVEREEREHVAFIRALPKIAGRPPRGAAKRTRRATVTSERQRAPSERTEGRMRRVAGLVVFVLCLIVAMPAWATFPTVTATAITTGLTPDATSQTINIPTCASGDLLVVITGARSAANSVTWPAGYEELFDTNASTGLLSAAYKVSNGSEGSTISVTYAVSNSPGAVAYCITGQHASTPIEAATAATNTTGTSANPDPPSFSPSWGSGEDTLWIALEGHAGSTDTTAFPTNYGSNQLEAHANAGAATRGSAAAATRESATSPENPSSFTLASGVVWVANTIAIRPASAAAAAGGCIIGGGIFRAGCISD